jgi:hypothetical protein
MKRKCDVLIHYDEENQKLIHYLVDSDEALALRAKTFDGVRSEVSFFKKHSPDEAERILGSAIFAGLDHGSISKINIRDYKAESDVALARWIEESEVAAQNGDAEAQYFLYMHYHSKALKSGQLSDLQRAENLLLASVNSGYPAAVKALEDWPIIKEAAENRIKRRASDNLD